MAYFYLQLKLMSYTFCIMDLSRRLIHHLPLILIDHLPEIAPIIFSRKKLQP